MPDIIEMCTKMPEIVEKFKKSDNFLGKGSFGEVKEIDGKAVKKVSLKGNTDSVLDLQ